MPSISIKCPSVYPMSDGRSACRSLPAPVCVKKYLSPPIVLIYTQRAMCGRYPEPWDYKDIEKFFDVLEDLYPGFRARYNVAPTQNAPVIRRGEHGRQIVAMRWVVIPYWAKQASIGNRMINARAESVL